MGSLYSAGSSSRWRLPRTREGFKKRSSLRNSLRTGVKGFDNFFDLMVDLTILMVVVVGKLGAPRSKREGKFYSNPERLTVTSLLSTGILICHCQPPHVTLSLFGNIFRRAQSASKGANNILYIHISWNRVSHPHFVTVSYTSHPSYSLRTGSLLFSSDASP